VDKVPGGPRIELEWGASCLASDTDYAVYQGMLGSFSIYLPRLCSTSGATRVVFTPPPDSVYYLVVPRNNTREGSYGTDSTGMPRPASGSACLAQSTATCP
jgi:hypothetical protein